jgi:hypothetical protein
MDFLENALQEQEMLEISRQQSVRNKKERANV